MLHLFHREKPYFTVPLSWLYVEWQRIYDVQYYCIELFVKVETAADEIWKKKSYIKRYHFYMAKGGHYLQLEKIMEI